MSTNLTDESKNAIENYLSKMKRVQKEFHELMKEEENKEIKLIEFITHIHKIKINENCHEFISFLHFLFACTFINGYFFIYIDFFFMFK